MQQWETAALKSGDLYPLLGLGQRPWIREEGRRVSGRVGTMGTRCFKLTGVGLSVIVWQATDLPRTPSLQKYVIPFWSPSVLHRGRGREKRGEAHACTDIHAYIHTCMQTWSHRQPWLCFFPLAYLVEWPWKTKQVLSTFDFSAFKLILSAQLLKQLSSPAVSNFRLGTFTGCQVLRLHCESLAPFLSKRYSNNLYFFLKGTCIALFFLLNPVYYILK